MTKRDILEFIDNHTEEELQPPFPVPGSVPSCHLVFSDLPDNMVTVSNSCDALSMLVAFLIDDAWTDSDFDEENDAFKMRTVAELMEGMEAFFQLAARDLRKEAFDLDNASDTTYQTWNELAENTEE